MSTTPPPTGPTGTGPTNPPTNGHHNGHVNEFVNGHPAGFVNGHGRSHLAVVPDPAWPHDEPESDARPDVRTPRSTATNTDPPEPYCDPYSPKVQGKHPGRSTLDPDHRSPLDLDHRSPLDPVGNRPESTPIDPTPIDPSSAAGHDASRVDTRRVRLTPASAIEPEPTYWLWDQRIPHGMITIGPGREGIGKSLFCAWLAAQVTTGALPGVHHGQPKGVIYAATEDSWEHTLAGRLLVAGADLDRVYRVEVEQIGGIAVPLSLPSDCVGMATAIRDADVALLVVDPLMSAIDLNINVNHDRDLRRALEPLADLANSTGCAVFGLAHFNKSTGLDPMSRIMGGRAFGAVARATIAFARDTLTDDGSCVISQIKNNLGPTELPSLRYVVEPVQIHTTKGPATWGRLVMTGETTTHVRQLMDETPPTKEETDTRKEVDRARQWLLAFLPEHAAPIPGQPGAGLPSKEIYTAGAEVGSWSDQQLKRAKEDTPIQTRKIGKAWYWLLPPDNEEEFKSSRNQESGRTDTEPLS